MKGNERMHSPVRTQRVSRSIVSLRLRICTSATSMSLCLRRWKEQGQWARWSLAKGQHVDVRSGNGYALMCAPAMFKFDQYHRAIGESSHDCCGSGRTIFVFICSCSCTVVCLIVARQALPP